VPEIVTRIKALRPAFRLLPREKTPDMVAFGL
jgi:hypothetical protein